MIEDTITLDALKSIGLNLYERKIFVSLLTKGVATAAGCFLVISPFVFLVCLLVYILVLCCWGYSSAGSLTAAAILPGFIWLSTHSAPITGCALIMAILIFIRHRDNIKRLLNGTEHSSLR